MVVLPAKAGVIPAVDCSAYVWHSAPREGGGDPTMLHLLDSLVFVLIRVTLEVLPAKAGVILVRR